MARNDSRNEARNTKDDGAGLTEKLRNKVEAGLEDAREATVAAGREVGETIERRADDGAQFVRNNPVLALAGAAAVGVLLGLALRPRH